MKKFYTIFLCALCAFAFFSCEREQASEEAIDGQGTDIEVPEGCEEITLTAICEATKTSLDGEGNTLWSEGDQIKVICSDNTVSNFTLVDGAGSQTGDFRGYIPVGKTALYAVYPASAYSSVSGSTVKVTIPASQAGTFAAGNIAVAKVAADHSMAFKNMNAFISFTLPSGTDVTSVEVESVVGASLGGDLSVNCSGEFPVATSTITNGASSITATTGSGAGTYFVSVIPGVGHAKGFQLTYKKGSEVTGVYYLNRNITTAANANYQMGTVETKGNYYVTVSGGGNHTGMDWANAFSKAEMWKRLTLTAAQAEDADTKAAKIAAINGATFHMAAGDYSFGTSEVQPTISFNETDQVSFTLKGGYVANPSAGATAAPATNATNIKGGTGKNALILKGNMNVTLDGLRFNGASLTTGNSGAVQCGEREGDTSYNLDVTMQNCQVTGNSNVNSGAGVHVYRINSFTADHVTFSGNSSSANTALRIAYTPVSVTDCVFDGNSSEGNAGALRFVTSSSTESSFTRCTFTNNVADSDGNYNPSTNESGKGGAAYIEGGKITFTSCTFSNNLARSMSGGAIYQQNSGSIITFTSCTFTGNEAYHDDWDNSDQKRGYGGAICVDGGSVTINGTNPSITGNKAWRGSAIFVKDNSTLNATGATISSNGDGTNGNTNSRNGAIYSHGTTTLTGCTMVANIAKYAAAVAIYKGTTTINGCTFQNHYSESGGAVEFEDATALNIGKNGNTPTRFINNSCGGQYKNGGALALAVASKKTGTVTISGAEFKGNHTEGEGGAIYGSAGGTLNVTISDTVFGGTGDSDPNYSDLDGGAISMKNGSYTLNNCTFTNNHAYTDTWEREQADVITTPDIPASGKSNVGYGGAIDCFETASLSLNGGTFEGNDAWRGGALNVNSTGTVTLTSVIFKNNGTTAHTRGGGVCYVKSAVTFDSCSLGGTSAGEGNSAHYGGAMQIVDGGVANINGGYVRYSQSVGSGGAIQMDTNGCLVVNKYNSTEATRFIGNHSPAEGGAIQIEANSTSKTSSITGAEFKGNYAQVGGAIYVEKSNTTLSIENCVFGGTGDNDPNYSDTYAGGAVYIKESDNVTFSGTNFTNNYSATLGGAIYASSSVSITGGVITGNHAQWGGALCIDNGATMTVYGGEFRQNYAKTGGAIVQRGNASLTIEKNGSTGTLFYQNYASNGDNSGANTSWGGAIRVDSMNGDFSCTGATFQQNHIDYVGTTACYGGAISITNEQNGVHANIVDCVFDSNSSACNGGSALSYQSSNGSSMGDKTGYMRVINCRFVGNHTDYQQSMGNQNSIGRHGGAIRLGHDATPSYFDGCIFKDNSTETSTENRISAYGGAITYYSDGMAYFNNCYFEGNHATRGGAISAADCGKSGLYLNACSFSGNYNSWGGGTTIVACGLKKFCMNNCSFNDNTYINTFTKGTNDAREAGSWVFISGSSAYGTGSAGGQANNLKLEELVLSNCTMIGTCRKTSSLTEITSDDGGRELIYIIEMVTNKPMYLINNAFINIKASDPAATSGLVHDAWWTNAESNYLHLIGYNNIWNSAGLTASTYDLADKGNSGYYNNKADKPTFNQCITKAKLGNPSWNSTTHVWPWNGSLTSGSYTKITASNFDSYMSTASSDFKAWLQNVDPKGPTVKNMLHTDQLGNSRGDGSSQWRPGAYQQ